MSDSNWMASLPTLQFQSGMNKPKKTTRNQNHDDASSEKRVKTCGNGGWGHWSDLNHQLLFVVMMQLGFFDYLSFRGVCKSWRSFAISNKKPFMDSKQPMTLHVTWRSYKKPCYLEDFEGKKLKTILPRFAGGVCVGLTSGYLIFFARTSREFWLVNPITRHQLHFPDFPTEFNYPSELDVKGILVFSRSLHRWVFLVIRKFWSKIWFSVAGEGDWDSASFTDLSFTDLRAFKGMIYTLNFNRSSNSHELHELRLNPEPELTLVETKNSLKSPQFHEMELVSSGENLYVMDCLRPKDNPNDIYRFQELDFDEMKWVTREKTVGENAYFLSNLKHGVAVTSMFWGSGGQCLLLGHNAGDKLKLMVAERPNSFTTHMWYFPHECLNVDRVDD
ncbi:unnamed protein product [Lactuca virosa]|uniref:F-box domain-containing protein n=1 Tax=Lactuca virosa TaxID=75947 RepID=A0AAU9PCM9_9ASTR|nr:unnamed protein product [Lactuca virosa]